MGFVKDKMNGWSEKNPQESADRTDARRRATILGRAIKNVTDLFTDDDLRRTAEVVRETLDADTIIVVPCGKGEAEIERVPDHKARMDAAKFITAMVDGTPIARQLVLHGDFKDLDAEKREVLMGSAAIQEALLELGSEAVDETHPEIC